MLSVKFIGFLIIIFGVVQNVHGSDFHTSREWLNALYYEPTPTGYKSLADSHTFFITDQGATRPKEELDASLKKVRAQDREFKDAFPYRYKLIAQHYGIDYMPVASVRDDFIGVTIAFPHRYMANPASMFGHLFVIMESKYGRLNSNMIHFLADTSNTNQHLYLVNGISGKFNGWFLTERYDEKIKDYHYVEDRAVTDYRMTLHSESLINMQLHAIELRHTHFKYYFFDENCAYFIGKFLNNFFETDVIQRHIPLHPPNVINALIEHGYVSSASNRVPSLMQFGQAYHTLNLSQKQLVKHLLFEPIDPVPTDTKVLKTFLLVSEYMINNQANYAPVIRANRIRAYQFLRNHNHPPIRQMATDQPNPNPIDSSGAVIGMSSYGPTIQIRPIYFGKNESLIGLEDNQMNGLFFEFQPNKNPRQTRLSISPVHIRNYTAFNALLTDFSWELNSTFSYQHRITMDHSFQYGMMYPLSIKTAVHGFIGATVSSYDRLMQRERPALEVLPSIQFGLTQLIVPSKLKLTMSYDRRYGNDYGVSTLDASFFGLFQELSHVTTADEWVTTISLIKMF